MGPIVRSIVSTENSQKIWTRTNDWDNGNISRRIRKLKHRKEPEKGNIKNQVLKYRGNHRELDKWTYLVWHYLMFSSAFS